MILGQGPQGVQGIPGPSASRIPFGGPLNSTINGGTKFLATGYHPPNNVGLLATDQKYAAVFDGTVDKFLINVLSNGLTAGTMTLTVYQNGVATSMTTGAIAAGVTGILTITANSFGATDGDVLSISAVASALADSTDFSCACYLQVTSL